jgi:FtsZ-binding cell division protein ZapB
LLNQTRPFFLLAPLKSRADCLIVLFLPADFSLEKNALMNQINELKEQLAALLKDLEDVRSDNTSLNQEKEKLQTETHSLQGRVRDLARLNAELEAQFAALKQELSERDADIRALNTRLEEAENALSEERRKEASLERALLMTKAELEEDEKNLAADKKLFAANDATMAALKQKVRDLEAALAVSRSKECLDPKVDEPKEMEALAMSRSKATRTQRSAPPPPPPAAVSEPPPPPPAAEEAIPIMMSNPKGSQAQRSAAPLSPPPPPSGKKDALPIITPTPPPPPPSGMEEALPIMMRKPKVSQAQRFAAPLPPPPPPGVEEHEPTAAAPGPPKRECGIGLLLERTAHAPGVHVKHVVPGGPAEMCGRIRPGDELRAVDGKSLAGVPLEQVFDMIIGQQGSQVTIDIAQDLSLEPDQLTLTRAFPVPATVTTPVEYNLDADAHRAKSTIGQHWLSGERSSSM